MLLIILLYRDKLFHVDSPNSTRFRKHCFVAFFEGVEGNEQQENETNSEKVFQHFFSLNVRSENFLDD